MPSPQDSEDLDDKDCTFEVILNQCCGGFHFSRRFHKEFERRTGRARSSWVHDKDLRYDLDAIQLLKDLGTKASSVDMCSRLRLYKAPLIYKDYANIIDVDGYEARVGLDRFSHLHTNMEKVLFGNGTHDASTKVALLEFLWEQVDVVDDEEVERVHVDEVGPLADSIPMADDKDVSSLKKETGLTTSTASHIVAPPAPAAPVQAAVAVACQGNCPPTGVQCLTCYPPLCIPKTHTVQKPFVKQVKEFLASLQPKREENMRFARSALNCLEMDAKCISAASILETCDTDGDDIELFAFWERNGVRTHALRIGRNEHFVGFGVEDAAEPSAMVGTACFVLNNQEYEMSRSGTRGLVKEWKRIERESRR